MLLQHNPLVIPILNLLRQQGAPLSEHELIAALRPQLEQVDGFSEAAQLALFQTHFLVMNALYRLQRDLSAEGLFLHISPLAIYLQPAASATDRTVAAPGDQALAAYYLDFANLSQTREDDVERMLERFWRDYIAHDRALDRRGEALAVLELPADAGWQAVQRRYRRLTAVSHPDRGGDARRFMAVREAYEVLRRLPLVD